MSFSEDVKKPMRLYGKPDCPNCGGDGTYDSGGEQPWGDPITVMCSCIGSQTPAKSVTLELTPEEASTLGAALTFALDVVGEAQPQDSTLQGVLDKLRALGVQE